MSLESVLKQLESRIEEFTRVHAQLRDRVTELESRLADVEGQAEARQAEVERLEGIDRQREELAGRLEALLETVDGALAATAPDE
jgi:septation ring formation regulator EzrA